ncbi:MAG TPA: hypothetical protein VGV92_04075 [Gammaproteobacteria bacterium]|nr:hypothetical protein [Gammaproteobacteria bacterium]
MYERLIADSSFEDETYDDESAPIINYDLSEAENAQIQIQVRLLLLKHFCADISAGLTRYVDERKKLTRARQQDVNAIKTIISEPQRFQSKEECMMAIQERLRRVKTGWFLFSGGSRMRTIIFEIIVIHSSPAIAHISQDLEIEKQAHRVLLKRYDFIKGDDIEELKREILHLREQGELMQKQLGTYTKSQERVEAKSSSSPQSFAARIKSLF